MMLPPPRRDAAWFPLDVPLGIQAKDFNLGFIRPDNLVFHVVELYTLYLERIQT